MFALLAVENTAYSFDKPFTYRVPKELSAVVFPGMRVTVPFGGGDRTRVAMVLSTGKTCETENVKDIKAVLDNIPVLSKEMLQLVHWMKSRYFCTLFDAVRLMLPAGISYSLTMSYSLGTVGDAKLSPAEQEIVSFLQKTKRAVDGPKLTEALGFEEGCAAMRSLISKGIVVRGDSAKRKIGDCAQKMIRPVEDFSGKLSPKQEFAYNTLLDAGPVSLKELSYFTGASEAVIKAMAAKGAGEFFEQESYRRPQHLKSSLGDEGSGSVQLSIEQNRVFDNLVDEYENNTGGVSLLYGVTGSGKTSVFLRLIDYVVGKGKEVILMVPEIALTPQTIDLFRCKFGDDIAVFHSGLSVGERLDEWKRAARGECKIAIGTRSAIFAPFTNLGLVVIDEEQEHTYKSEMSPRYNAKDIAKFRCAYSKAFCLLCSATPSLESYHMAKKGKYGFNRLELRFGDAQIPEVRLVDMNQEAMFGNATDISFALKRALNDNLRDKKQSIVLLNRRGYHTFARCSQCHAVISCPNCSISLTLHSANNRLMCHYCGHSVPMDIECPECSAKALSFSGYGTQRAEEALAQAVPGARILRIDADSTAAKFSLEKKLDAFSNGEYDIMVGTQMVAKGLNFENVTLVGVVSADQSLYSDDFRSNERTFDLLTQVVGRSGRGKYPGQAIIQTNIPENPYLRLAASQDYLTFYEMEISFRAAMLYPPFVDLLVLGFIGEDEEKVHAGAELFLRSLSTQAQALEKPMPMRALRPSSAAIPKIAGKYRYKIIIKCKNTLEFRGLISGLLVDFAKNREFAEVTAFADPNPYTII